MLTKQDIEFFRNRTHGAFLGIRYPAPTRKFRTVWEVPVYGTLALSQQALQTALTYLLYGALPEDAIANAMQVEDR